LETFVRSRFSLFTAIAAAAIAFAPRAAHACNAGNTNNGNELAVLLGGDIVLLADAPMLISDLVLAARSTVPSMGHGVGEAALALPTTAFGAFLLYDINRSGYPTATANVLASTIVLGGLFMATHAVWTFASQPPSSPAPSPAASASGDARISRAPIQLTAAPMIQLSVAPTLLTFRDHGGDKLEPGVGALLRF
jgi:hypothetical protein